MTKDTDLVTQRIHEFLPKRLRKHAHVTTTVADRGSLTVSVYRGRPGPSLRRLATTTVTYEDLKNLPSRTGLATLQLILDRLRGQLVERPRPLPRASEQTRRSLAKGRR